MQNATVCVPIIFEEIVIAIIITKTVYVVNGGSGEPLNLLECLNMWEKNKSKCTEL